jgi:NADH dehydrogenase
LAVRQAFADAILIRPAVMFGRDDAFLTPILKLLNRLPVFPMFGDGQMRLQPVYVEDVGHAIAKIMQWEQTGPTVFECGGPPASTPTRSSSELSRMQPAPSRYCFRSRSLLGAHRLGFLNCCRVRPSHEIK